MGNVFSLVGRYRAPGGVESDVAVGASRDNGLFVTQGALRLEEPTRSGKGFSVIATAAVAALVVRPTTAAAVEIWNGYQGGGPSLVVDRLFSEWLVSTAAAAGAQIWAMVTTPKAAPTGALTPTGNFGQAYGGPVLVGVGTTVVANGWYPYGMGGQGPGTATPGAGLEALVEGRLIVPPQCSLCIHVLASLVGDTFCSGASWFEKQIDLALP
jgi:hypothetical protein